MLRMQSNNVDLSAYEELFAFACPKFVSPSPPPYDDLPPTYNPQEAYRLQLKLFLAEVRNDPGVQIHPPRHASPAHRCSQGEFARAPR